MSAPLARAKPRATLPTAAAHECTTEPYYLRRPLTRLLSADLGAINPITKNSLSSWSAHAAITAPSCGGGQYH
jgi:hypothetical protein